LQKEFGDRPRVLRHSRRQQIMDFFGQLGGELDMAPFTTGMGWAGNPAANGFPLIGPFAGHFTGDEDLRGRGAGMKRIDEGHDIEPGKLRVLELNLVGEGTALVGLREQPPLVHLNDHIGIGLRVTAGRDPEQAVTHPTGDNSLKQKNKPEAGLNIGALA